MCLFVYLFFQRKFWFSGHTKMLLLCKIRILVFLLILGLTIQNNSNKKTAFLCLSTDCGYFSVLVSWGIWVMVQATLFFQRPVWLCVGVGGGAHIGWVVCWNLIGGFCGVLWLSVLSWFEPHPPACCVVLVWRHWRAPATWSVDILMKNNVDFVWVLHLGWNVYTLVKHCWLFVMP